MQEVMRKGRHFVTDHGLFFRVWVDTEFGPRCLFACATGEEAARKLAELAGEE